MNGNQKNTTHVRALNLLLLVITGLSALLTAGVVYLAWPLSRDGIQKYRDLIVGEITLTDSFKSGDYLLSYLAVAVFLGSWLLLALLGRQRLFPSAPGEPADGPSDGQMPARSLVWGMAAFLAGLLLVRRPFGSLEVALLGLLVLYWGLAVGWQGRTEALARHGVWLVVTTLFSLASLLGICALVNFIVPAATLWSDALPRFAAIAAALVALALCGGLRLPPAGRTRLTLAAQWAIPLLLLVGFTRVFRQGSQVTGNEIPLATKALALLFASGGVLANVRLSLRSLASAPTDGEWPPVLLPSVIAIGGFLAFKTPEYFPLDYFHVGESWITWQQIAELGKFPYSGYAIQRGFVDMVPGLLNVLFFDGTYGSYNSAFALWWLLGGALAAWLTCRTVGTGWGLVLTLCLAPLAIFKLWLFLPIMLILAHPGLLANPGRWLVAWFFSCLTYCLYQHTNGIALTLGTMPVAGWIVLGALRSGELKTLWQRRRGLTMTVVAACLLTLLLLSPVLLAWVTFIREQGGANEIANGTLLGQRVVVSDWFRWQNSLVWELFRSGGWLVGIALLWHLFVRERLLLGGEGRRWQLTPQAVVCLTGVIAAIGFIPYSMGRIDVKGLSRPGSIMQLLLGCLIPLALILGRRWQRSFVTCTSVGLLLGIVVASDYTDLSLLPVRAMAALEVPASAVRVDGSQLGLPRLGKAFVEPDRLQDISSVKEIMDLVLRPGETYLDLTNNMAFYPLLGKGVPSVYAGYYIATSQQIQERMLRAMTQTPPPLVWVAPARTFGTGTAALRSYRLYRWVMQQGYQPIEVLGGQFLVRKDRYLQLKGQLNEQERIRLSAQAFSDADLAYIPVAWGRSYPLLARRFERLPLPAGEQTTGVGRLAVPEAGAMLPSRLVSLRFKEPVDGGRWDFMALTVTAARQSDAPLKVRISWAPVGGQSDELHSVTFMARSGAPLLIPLGASPAWLLTPQLATMAIEVADLDGSTEVNVGQPILLSLKQ